MPYFLTSPLAGMSFALLFFLFVEVQCFCGENVRWSHSFNMEEVYGVWYGVGYAQHTPDMTNKPKEVGCVTIYISDASTDTSDDWIDWSLLKRNYSDNNWISDRNNPWSDTRMAGSWLDYKLNRRSKRDMYQERKLTIIWDEDGQSMEQTYVYSTVEPGVWTAEQTRPGEKEMMARGVDIWYPDDPPRHPEVIRVLKVTPHMLIINHCTELGGGGIFSLILRRSPSRIDRWQWYDLQREFFSFELPAMYRYTAVCGACNDFNSIYNTVLSLFLLFWCNKILY